MVGGPGGIEAFNSRFQPKPISRGSLEPQWPSSPVFGSSGADTLGDLRRRIDSYDKAAVGSVFHSGPIQKDTFAPRPMSDQWAACTGHRLVRDFGGDYLDKHVILPHKVTEALKSLGNKANPFVQASLGYGDVFKMDYHVVMTGPQKQFKSEWDCLFSRDGRQQLAEKAYQNIRSLKKPDINPFEYFKRVVVSGNISDVTAPLENERFFTGIFKAGWLFLGALPVFERTLRTFQDTHSGLASAKTFARESMKALASWEFATVGTLIGGMLCPVKGAAMLFSKAICMGLFSAMAHSALDKLIHEPERATARLKVPSPRL